MATHLKDDEILDLAYGAGWRKSSDLEWVLATSLAESGNNPTAVSRTGCCHGLMQINTNSTTKTVAQLEDPATNMAEAFRLWSARGRQPWISSKIGQLAWGPRARFSLSKWHLSPGVGTQGTAGAVTEAAGAVPGLSGTLQAAEKARAWVTTPANIGRLAYGIIGAVIIVVGLAVLARPAVEETVKTVASVK